MIQVANTSNKWEEWLRKNLNNNPIVFLSGGTDSTLALYLTCYYISKNNLDCTIQPCFIYDRAGSVDSLFLPRAKLILNYVKDIFNDVNIKDLYVYYHSKKHGELKDRYYSEAAHILNSTCEIYGGISKPDHFPFPPGEERCSKEYKENSLLGYYDKRDEYKFYLEFNLQEIFPFTLSCTTANYPPCKKCWPCKEKKWGFGVFDGDNI